MSNIAQITPYLKNVEAPAAIRDLPGWVIWRLEHHEGEAKPRKVPYYANGNKRAGKQGAPQDVAHLVTFDAARRAASRRGFDGVGFATLPQFGVCALDFDNCMVDGKIHPEVQALLGDTYAEFSPSGQGVRVFFQGHLGNHKDLDKRNPFGFETFSTKGFVTFTGNTLEITEVLGNENTVAPLNDAAHALYRKRFGPSEWEPEIVTSETPVMGLTRFQIEDMLRRIDPDCDHDQWLHVGMGLHHETHGAGFEFWDNWSAQGSKYPGTDSLQSRWDSFGKQDGRTVTVRTALKLAGITLDTPASAEDFEVLVDAAVEEAKADPDKPPRFRFEPVHLFSSTKALPWVIKGVLPQAGLAVIYGASGSGKSFAVLDMAFAIARGTEWRSRKVKQGRVAYIAAEGADGFRKRLAAYAITHQVDLEQVPMTVLDGAPNLMLLDDAKDLAVGVLLSGGASVIVVDTLAQTTPGANENAGEDMGKALGHCKRLHELTGALVVLIHHSGKDATKGARGWSGLRAAADAEIEVLRNDAGGRSLRLSKNKDGEDGLEWGFQLDIVELGIDEDMDPITSCVVSEAEITAVRALRVLGPNEEVVNQVIQEIAQSQTAGIEPAAVIMEAIKRLPPPENGKRDTRKLRVKRALESLCNGDNAPYWIADDNCITVV